MTGPVPEHHPSPQTLACHAAGNSPGPVSFVMAQHIKRCPECRQASADLADIGGALLCEAPAAPVDPDALSRTLDRLGEPLRPKPLGRDLDLSPTRMRWCAPGIWRRLLGRDGDFRAWVVWFKLGSVVPKHWHTGLELTLFLSGTFTDERGTYRAGDLREYYSDEADELHCSTEGPGLGVLVVEGPLRYWSGVARAVMPKF